ncbi:MAG: GGDEF domain-containing protein [Treponema sp.]|nr:GGDEF domain-containing protein [Treponema sp.]
MERKNNKTWNISIGGSIVAALCIIIYLFALIQGVVRVYLSIEQRSEVARIEFSQLYSLAQSEGIHGFMSESYKQTMNNALISTKSIEALIITGSDNAFAFEKQRDNAITWVNNTPRFKNKFSFSNENFYESMSIQDIRNANIQAVASAFDYSVISKILKETLILILIGFAIAFITMLLQLLLTKPVKGDMVLVPTNEQKKKVKQPYESESVRINPLKKVFSDTSTNPKGLYSPRSNIGWEEYIKDRLDSELHRCSSTEKDLSLVLMDFENVSDDEMFRQAAEEAVSFYTSRDLLFEYGKQGVAVILPGIGLDSAIEKSEKFYQRVMEKFIQSQDDIFNIKIGLSSRAGRLLNADRIMLETKEALKKAKNDPRTSIIAFKSDPEKYRDYIRTSS